MPGLSTASTSPHCTHGNQLPAQETIGQLFRDYGEEYIKIYQPDIQTIKLIRSIRLCRTPALGGYRIKCKGCDQERYQYFSCGNNQCPQCQGIKREQWQDRLSTRMLAVPYVHTTFTLPHQLNGIARRNRNQIYGLLFRSSWKTIDKLSKDKNNIGGKPGMSAVLHTWGSDLKYHVHVHCLITFGGLAMTSKQEWKWPKQKNKLAKYRKICSVFRSIFMKGLKSLMQSGIIIYHRNYAEVEEELLKKRWVVHNTRPTSDTQVIEQYLSRYICRIGITNSRLSYDSKGKNVKIKYNDYSNQKKGEAAPKKYRHLNPLIAMQMILQHQVPRYFQRVRHYGLHSTVTYKKIKDQLPNHLKRNGHTVRTVIQILKSMLKQIPYCCTNCGGFEFEKEPIAVDQNYIGQYITLKKRGPPLVRTGASEDNKNN